MVWCKCDHDNSRCGECGLPIRPLRKRRSSLPKPKGPGRSRKERKAERRERIAKIRTEVVEAAGDVCEFPSCGLAGSDLHHCIGGGLRRAKESAKTCLLLCRVHHRLAHAGDTVTLEALATYCESSGMHGAGAALRRKLDKITEARAQHPERKTA